MTETLRVRVYNVRFGDAVLVSVPDRPAGGVSTLRHILIDVGNVASGEGGADEVFSPVFGDLTTVLNGRPVDLYIMTHEHMDHVQGLLYAANRLQRPVAARYSWLTASSAPRYYARNKKARRQRDLASDVYRLLTAFATAEPEEMAPFRAVMHNNNPRITSECVAYLRSLSTSRRTAYVHREFRPAGSHPFKEAKLEVWAPEKDASEYYGKFRPMSLGLALDGDGMPTGEAAVPIPLAGVDADTFYDLVEWRKGGFADNLMTIDQAANNTSVVLCLEWRGWRLLFPGDAEIRSWKTMDREDVLRPVHFLKVSHHGSRNGSPAEQMDKILPATSPDRRPRYAVMTTFPDVYPGIPDDSTARLLQGRCDCRTVQGLPDGGCLDYEFDDDGRSRVRVGP